MSSAPSNATRIPEAWRRAAGFSALTGAALYVLGVILAGSRRAGYDHGRQLISELGETGAPDGPLFRTMLALVGVIAFGLAFALHRSMSSTRRAALGPVLVALVGASLLAGAVFPCDPTCAPHTLPGWLHILTSVPGTIGTLAAPFAFARRARRDPRWAPYARASMLCGAAAVTSIVLAFGVFGPLNLGGLGQRLAALAQLAWFVVMGVALIRLEGPPRDG